MRILILGSGKSYHATRWANSLAQRDIEVGFATVHQIDRPLSPDVTLFALSKRKKLAYLTQATRLRKILRSWKPDILHAHYATGYGLMSKLTGFKPRIVSLYGADIYDFPKKSFLHKTALRFFLSNAQILSTSGSMAHEYLRTFPRKEKPTVTPFGVDIDLFRPSNEQNTTKDNIHVGIVKKLEPKYGVDVLLRSFAHALDLSPSNTLFLHIAGDGTKKTELEDLAKSLNISEKVTFYGNIPNKNVPHFLNGCDLFVLPSRSESFGVAAVEAMACGLPVIASDVGGLPEVVKNDTTGLIIPKEDVSALANAILTLAENENLRNSYGQAARDRVQTLFNWDKNVDQMVRIYESTLTTT